MDVSRADNYFANWTLAYIMYCDGSSYTGNLASPVPYQNQTVYFRGRQVLDALLNDIQQFLDLLNPLAVVVTGSSAGAVTVYTHLDHIAEVFHNSLVVGMPDAGYFLNVNNTKGQNVFGSSMQVGVALWGATRDSFDAGCAARVSGRAV